MKAIATVCTGILVLGLLAGVQTARKQPRRVPRVTPGPCKDEDLDRAIPKLSAFAKMFGLPPITRKTIWHSYCNGVEGCVSVEVSVQNEKGEHCGQYKDNAEGPYHVRFERDVSRSRYKGLRELSKERLLQIATMYRNRLKTDRKLVFTGEAPQIKSTESSYYGPMPTSYQVYWEERVAGYGRTAGLGIALEPHTGELKSIGWGYSPYDKPKHELLRQSQAIEIAKKYVADYRKRHPFTGGPFPEDQLPYFVKNDSRWCHHGPNYYEGEDWETIPHFVALKGRPLRVVHSIYIIGKNKSGVKTYDNVQVDAETGKVVGGVPWGLGPIGGPGEVKPVPSIPVTKPPQKSGS